MALYITEKNRDPSTPAWGKIRLRGFLLENPCTLEDECDKHFEFTQYQMTYLYRHYFLSHEKYQEYRDKCLWVTEECEKIRIEIEDAFINMNVDIRNIYKDCFKQIGPEHYKCIDKIGIDAFLNHPNVKEDMHADVDTKWELCNFDVMENMVRDPAGSVKIYEKLLREEHNLRIVSILLCSGLYLEP